MALNPVDYLLAGYLGFVTILTLLRGPSGQPALLWILVMHALFGVMLWLFTRLRPEHRLGRALHVLYPIVMLLPFYAEIGLLNLPHGWDRVFENDAVVQGWEHALFGGQVSYTWIRDAPSVFWSGLLHLAYFAYYPIVLAGPIALALRGRLAPARTVVLTTMVAFVVCYLAFILFPVAGPNYTFEHPTGPVREVWSARLVYGVLAGGSSFGAAFPSSHVAATVAATWALWRVWRNIGMAFTLPAVFLTVGTVYCQMHYAVDAGAGLLVGVGAGLGVAWWERGAGAGASASVSIAGAATPR